MIGKSAADGIGLSAIVSVGNKADIDETDLLEYFRRDRLTKVVLMYIEGVKNGDRLIKVLNSRGNLVPLSSVASFRRSRGMAFYRHVDRERSITVTADIDERVTTSVDVNARMAGFCRALVKDLPDIRVKFGGEDEKTRESLQSLFRAFGIAFLLVFTILVATFQSVVQPLVILLAIPFGLIGVVLAFYFHGWPLTFLALMGVVGLTGVVVNDSIILVV